MGLSVLIPLYNIDCRQFIGDLLQQLEKSDTTFEIICLDDQSDKIFQDINRTFIALYNRVQYHLLENNLGRSKVRNRLAQLAQYDYLLFLDCDQKVVRRNYISSYLKRSYEKSVLYGGTTYSMKPPQKDRLLRWHFGRKREMISTAQRSTAPHHYFMTNNFLIPKALFLSIQFNESIIKYGHEDTLFAIELKKKGIDIIHLDNPVEHLGLDTNEQFLEKSATAIETLVLLIQAGHPIQTKLLRTYSLLKKYHLHNFYKWLFQRLEKWIRKQIINDPSKLYYFDLWKLGKISQALDI